MTVLLSRLTGWGRVEVLALPLEDAMEWLGTAQNLAREAEAR